MTDNTKSPWPDVPRIVFGPGDPGTLNACIEWVMSRPDRLQGYAEGYRIAARCLHAVAEEQSVSPDRLVFPLAFLWRHHVELMLKDIIARGRALDGGEPTFPEHHRLVDLWNEALGHIRKVGNADRSDIAVVAQNMRELERIDAGSFAFRYPAEKGTGEDALRGVQYINLRTLQEAIEPISNFLNAAISVQSQRAEHLIAEGVRTSGVR
jgi:hypothetical protein